MISCPLKKYWEHIFDDLIPQIMGDKVKVHWAADRTTFYYVTDFRLTAKWVSSDCLNKDTVRRLFDIFVAVWTFQTGSKHVSRIRNFWLNYIFGFFTSGSGWIFAFSVLDTCHFRSCASKIWRFRSSCFHFVCFGSQREAFVHFSTF